MISPALVWAPTAARHEAPAPPAPPLTAGDRGPDVASYQGYPDWSAVAQAGFRFAFTKVTEGISYRNPYFSYNWPRIADAGMVRGAYHFARPDDAEAWVEADWFVRNLGPLGTYDMPVLDLEDGHGDLSDWAIRFMSHVTYALGRKPLLYSGAYFMQDHGLNSPEVAGQSGGLWLAAYTSSKPAVPPGWSEILFWQFTDSHTIPGITGGVDCNIYRP